MRNNDYGESSTNQVTSPKSEATTNLTRHWHFMHLCGKKSANFPHSISSIDGKHIRSIKPEDSGSLYHNYLFLYNTLSGMWYQVQDYLYHCRRIWKVITPHIFKIQWWPPVTKTAMLAACLATQILWQRGCDVAFTSVGGYPFSFLYIMATWLWPRHMKELLNSGKKAQVLMHLYTKTETNNPSSSLAYTTKKFY